MSIDTRQKRHSAIGARRLPWMRRFHIPIPDGTIDQGDRQHLLGLCAVPLAGAAVVVEPTFFLVWSGISLTETPWQGTSVIITPWS